MPHCGASLLVLIKALLYYYYLHLIYALVDYSHNLHTKSRVLLHLEIWVTYAGESVTWRCDVSQNYEVFIKLRVPVS